MSDINHLLLSQLTDLLCLSVRLCVTLSVCITWNPPHKPTECTAMVNRFLSYFYNSYMSSYIHLRVHRPNIQGTKDIIYDFPSKNFGSSPSNSNENHWLENPSYILFYLSYLLSLNLFQVQFVSQRLSKSNYSPAYSED